MDNHPRLIPRITKEMRTTARHPLREAMVRFSIWIAVTALVFIPQTTWPLDPNTLPTGGQIVAGSGSIVQSGSTLTVNQDTSRMIANWSTFNIGQAAAVTFRQLGTSSITLNRILDQNPSQILGSLTANGQVFLLNPSGIYFGPSATVDVGGLVASSLNISNENFLSGKYSFATSGTAGAIYNYGNIRTRDGGYIAFLSPRIENSGTLTATSGTVALAAGDKVSLDFTGDRLVNFTVDAGAIDALIENKGLIEADGGTVFLTAKAADSLTNAVVNNEGVIKARTLANQSGRILLVSDKESGETIVGGTLDASAPDGGDGGFIETSAARVTIRDDALITTAAPNGNTGQWLIDPYDFTIAASGGDVTGAALTAALANTDVTIQTQAAAVSCTGVACTSGAAAGNGDIFVNDSITWASHKLTLNAYRNIEINKELFGSGTAQLALLYGQGATDGVISGTTATYSVNAPVNLAAGNNFFTQLGSDTANLKTYTVITSLGDAADATGGTNQTLQGMARPGNFTGNYVLGANIDASATSGWNAGAGFLPIGTTGNPGEYYSGVFDGLGHTITGLYINAATNACAGLFGFAIGASISNVGLVNGSVTGNGTHSYAGGLVGASRDGTIANCYNTGTVSGNARVGGLVGYIYNGTITHSYATGAVTGASVEIGGLAGADVGADITDSYATGTVTGSSEVGGLVGYNGANISRSYATGSVSGLGEVGGLVGVFVGDTIDSCYATGPVSGSIISVGGLVGVNYAYSTINDSYASGRVMCDSYVGGLVGENYGKVNRSFYDTETTGRTDTGKGDGKTTAELMTQSTYTGAGWDFTNTWYMIDGETRPFLRSEYSTIIKNAHQLQLMALNPGASYTLADNLDMTELTLASGHWKTAASTAAQKGFVPVGSSAAPFTGAFDGQGHSITGLYINRAATDAVGLFGYINGAGISNVGIVNGSVTGQNYVGGLVGYSDGGAITGSYATDSVTGTNYVGGLVGYNDSGTITGSYATGLVTGTSNLGGLVGYNDSGTISNSFWDTVTTGQSTSSGGGTGLTTADLMTQSTYADAGWDFTNTWYMIDGETRPFLRSEYSTIIKNAHQLQLMALNPAASYTLAGNLDLSELTQASGHWKTAAGTATQKGFVPVGNSTTQFTGAFNGKGYTITGLYINRPTTDAVGLFGYINGAAISNVALVNGAVTGQNDVGGLVGYDNAGAITGSYTTGTVTGKSYVGGLIGYNDSASINTSYHTTGSVTGTGDYIGGLVGYNSTGAITGSYNTSAVSGQSDVGGLVGYDNAGAITGSYTTGTVTGKSCVGGLIGYNDSASINTSYHTTGSVTGTGDYIGGLVGYNSTGTITGSYNTSAVSGTSDVGGLVGYNSTGAITGSYNTSAVSGTSDVGGLVGYNSGAIDSSDATGAVEGINDVGGLVGYNSGAIDSSDATGAIEGVNDVGGLVGYNLDTVTNSHATGAVTGVSGVGGLVGYNTAATISGSYAEGAVTGTNYNGGLVGYNSGSTIVNSCATGSVTGSGTHTGGLAGYNDGSIINSYAEGAVSGAGDYVGGLIGYNKGNGTTTGTITKSFATGLTTSTGTNRGGLVGYNDGGTITGSFWDTATTGQATSSGGGTGLTTAELMTQSTYTSAGWDFTNTWYMIDGETRPFLRSEYSTIIKNTHQLQLMALNPSASYTLADNIEMTELAQASGHWKTTAGTAAQKGFMPIGSSTAPFTGAFDGQGHSITGLYINRPTTDAVGLFGYINGAGISNVGIVNGSVTGQNYVGGLVGYSDGGAITGSYATDSVTGTNYVGGLVGYNRGDGSTTGTINKSYATGLVTGTGNVGGLAGYNDGGTITSSYWDTVTTGQATSSGGGTGLTTDELMSKSTYTGTYTDTDWDFTNTWYMIDGETRPFLRSEYSTIIKNAHQLQLMALNPSASYTLADNIDLTELTLASGHWKTAAGTAAQKGFVPIGNSAVKFTGAFNGQGYTITGLYINRPTTDYVGLFGYINGAGISNVALVNGAVTGQNYVGGLVGYDNAGAITGSYTTGTVTGQSYVGGLIGYNNSASINTSYHTTGSVTGTGDYIGGLVGYDDYGDITDSYAEATVTGTGDYIGGLAGKNFQGTITSSHAEGTVTGNNYTGGLVGYYAGDTITGSYAECTVTGAQYVGGLTGYLTGESASSYITNSHAKGSVKGTSYVGGLVGENYIDSTITGSYAEGTVTGTGASTGGLVGRNEWGFINNSYSEAVVTGKSYTGGLVGYNTGGSTIENSYTTGAVTGTTYVGGLVGYNDGYYLPGFIENSYATGAVTGATYVGGLVGYNYGVSYYAVIENSYATGLVSGTANVGGLVGYNDGGTVTNSFYDKETTGRTDTGKGTGKTTEEMKTLSTFSSALWDIDDAGSTGKTWRIYEGDTYPLLRSFLTAATATPATTKVYDGTTTVPYTWTTAVDTSKIFGTTGYLADSKNVGTRTVTVGADSFYSSQQGYDITVSAGSVAITPKVLTITGTTAEDKTYDGTVAATILVGTIGGLVGTETLTATATGSFDSKNAGTRSTTATYTLADGTNDGLADNYTLADSTGLTATITPKTLTAAYTGTNKVYDATTTATVTGASGDLIAGDIVSLTQTANFTDKNVGTGKSINISGIAISGTDAANYSLQNTTAETTADITKAPLTVTANSDQRLYSGIGYFGGNGVTYAGFAVDETLAVLDGTLGYGGTSQGAINVGTYTINPQGLTSGNYVLCFVGGFLTITESANSRPDVYGIFMSSQEKTSISPTAGSTTLENMAASKLVTAPTKDR